MYITDKGLRYEVLSKDGNTGTVSVVEASKELNGEVNIPESIEREGVVYRVIWISRCAFYKCCRVSAVTISKGIQWIGENAFGSCKKLKRVMIPETVTWIGSGAFANCEGLRMNISKNNPCY